MKYLRLFFLFAFFLIFFLNSFITASEISKKLSEENLSFGIYTVPAQKRGIVNLYLYLKIPHSFFRFIKVGDKFLADYEFAFEITNKLNRTSKNKILHEKITVSDFDDTNSDNKFLEKKTIFDVTAGKYEVRLVITDLDIKKSITLTKESIVTDFWKEKIGIGDILFLVEGNSISKEDKSIIIPKPQINVDYNSALVINYQIFKSDLNNKLNLTTKIVPKFSQGSPVFEEEKQIDDKRHAIERNIMLFPADLPVGPYILNVELKDGELIKEREVEFFIFWEKYPIAERDFERSIEQMKYIFTDEEYDTVSSASKDEKKEFFYDFWKKMDSDTTTERNELMEEYFRRTDYADQNFSEPGKEGYKSDMGKVYILYGRPDNIIKKHDLIPPYETWEYYDINRKYIFWDEFSSGVFKIKSVYPLKR